MKTIQNYISCVMLFLAVILCFPMLAQQSMSLGDLRFIMPSESMSKAQRSLTMKMAITGITPKFYAKVGGVAFIQTAQPNFLINTLQVGTNLKDNTAYMIINDTTYQIPLEVWELQSIVNYADDDNNAAVTLYGEQDVRIKYHSAFLDNLMGLRMLQTDMMLLPEIDRSAFPSYNNGEYILSNNETQLYEIKCFLDSLQYGYSYDDMSKMGYLMFSYKMDSIGESFDTYIYTDYDRSISFYSKDQSIEFIGEPYYRFASRDSSQVDTLEMYYTLNDFIDTIQLQQQLIKGSYVQKIYSKKQAPLFYELSNIMGCKKSIEQKAVDAFILTDYDNLSIKSVNTFKGVVLALLCENLKSFADSVILHSSNCNSNLVKICVEYNKMQDSFSFFHYPIIAEYAKLIANNAPQDSTAVQIGKIAQLEDFSPHALLLDFMYLYRTPAINVANEMTNYFKDNNWIITRLNPIVYATAIKVCQWSALFRFIKLNYPQEWMIFKDAVQRLEYDAPIVQTPINYEYKDETEKSLFELFMEGSSNSDADL